MDALEWSQEAAYVGHLLTAAETQARRGEAEEADGLLADAEARIQGLRREVKAPARV